MNEQSRDFSEAAANFAELTDIIVDQITKLAKLHEAGILTDEEFADKKADLLSRL